MRDTKFRSKEIKTMMKSNILKGTLLAFCLLGMLVLPAAAAGQVSGTASTATIDSGLKQDLWSIHMQYRLQEFDNHVQEANDVIGVLGKYNIDTTQMQATLNTISGKRSELQTDLQNQDKNALKTLNTELQSLWKQFAQEMRETIKNHYQAIKASKVSSGTSGNNDVVLPTTTVTEA